VAAYRLYQTRVLLEFPILFLFLITSATKSTLLVQARHTPESYATVYSISVPVMLVLQYLCGIEIFERLTGNYPRFGHVGKLFLAAFALLGVSATSVTQHIGVPATWVGVREAAILLERYGLEALFVGLVLMAIFIPRVQSLPVPDNARRAAMILAFYVFGNATTATMLVGTNAQWRLVPAYVTIITGLLAAVGWMTLRAENKEPSPAVNSRSVREALRDYLRLIRALRTHAALRLAERQ